MKVEHFQDEIRRAFICCMKTGNKLVFQTSAQNFVRLISEFADFPWNDAFSFTQWRENYRIMLKPEEDIDFLGNKGGFKMKETFDILILVQG